MTEAPGTGSPPSRPGPAKGPAAFRSISEASTEVGVPQHVLRFWETRFAFIRPTKRAGGRRFYRPQDLEVLRGVRVLLQDEGYTIKGVQKLHKEQGLKRLLAAAGVDAAAASRVATAVEDDADALSPDAEAPVLTETEIAGIPDDEPETGDLFNEPPVPAPESTGRERRSSRSVLDVAARARLAEVLGDLEATKAEIDALLAGG